MLPFCIFILLRFITYELLKNTPRETKKVTEGLGYIFFQCLSSTTKTLSVISLLLFREYLNATHLMYLSIIKLYLSNNSILNLIEMLRELLALDS